ncbi:MAG TPA: DUF2127 domain-containing protein [candidate division Zixibacteria bacterium]|nr:DUF2127 domain-containing protein [candidate division Zixibacteria bacterium]
MLVIIGGVLGIVSGLAAFLEADSNSALVGAGIGTLIVAAAQLIVGIGLWSLQKWAWALAAFVLAIRVIGDFFLIFSGGSVAAAIVNLVITAVLLWYLFRPNVQQAFGR